MSNNFSCDDCPYYFFDSGDNYPSCHYIHNDGCAPCEIEEPEQVNWEDYI